MSAWGKVESVIGPAGTRVLQELVGNRSPEEALLARQAERVRVREQQQESLDMDVEVESLGLEIYF